MKYSRRQLVKAQQLLNKEYINSSEEYREITDDKECAKAQVKQLLKHAKPSSIIIKKIEIDGCFLTIIIGIICFTIISVFH